MIALNIRLNAFSLQGSGLYFTAIGDTVNTASRLESYTKEYVCQLIVSDAAARQTGFDFSSFKHLTLSIRGKKQGLPVRITPEFQDIHTANP